MTMPPSTGDPEASRPYFRRLRELAERTACASSRWERARTTAWPPRRARRWCGWDPMLFRALSDFRTADGSWQTSGTGRSSTSASPRRTTYWDEDGYAHRGGSRAHVQRAPERPPAPTPRRRQRRSSTTGPSRSPSERPRRAQPVVRHRARPRRSTPCDAASGQRAPRRAAELQRRAADRGQASRTRCR